LLQSGLIAPSDLERKYANEIHANEIVPLSYNLAKRNIEEAYREASGEHSEFAGLNLVDTFLDESPSIMNWEFVER